MIQNCENNCLQSLTSGIPCNEGIEAGVAAAARNSADWWFANIVFGEIVEWQRLSVHLGLLIACLHADNIGRTADLNPGAN